jgi:hypothetical protein
MKDDDAITAAFCSCNASRDGIGYLPLAKMSNEAGELWVKG